MSVVIGTGACVSNADREGGTAVLHAVDSNSCDASRILIRLCANVNPIVRKGLFCSSLLTAAAFAGKLSIVQPLLEAGFGVDVTYLKVTTVAVDMFSLEHSLKVDCSSQHGMKHRRIVL
jgi:hypothetical protein